MTGRFVSSMLLITIMLVIAFTIYRSRAWRQFQVFDLALLGYFFAGLVLTQVFVLDRYDWFRQHPGVTFAVAGALLVPAMAIHAIATLQSSRRVDHELVLYMLGFLAICTLLAWMKDLWQGSGGYLDRELPLGGAFWVLLSIVELGYVWLCWRWYQHRAVAHQAASVVPMGRSQRRLAERRAKAENSNRLQRQERRRRRRGR